MSRKERRLGREGGGFTVLCRRREALLGSGRVGAWEEEERGRGRERRREGGGGVVVGKERMRHSVWDGEGPWPPVISRTPWCLSCNESL